MTRFFSVDPITLHAQRRASDPRVSAWVSANAGSGKTHVLAQRVKRLLLSGMAPEKILCLTFTKAAAANMSNRVLNELAGWARMEEKELRTTIASLDGRSECEIANEELQRARQLFARALETPGGLKIQTIHAFCDALLHRFPFEAGLAGKFQIMDDLQGQDLVTSAFEAVMNETHQSSEHAALQNLLRDIQPEKLRELISKSLDNLRSAFGASDLRVSVFNALHLDPLLDLNDLYNEILENALPQEEWPQIIDALQRSGSGKNTGKNEKLARKFQHAVKEQGEARVTAYLDIFQTKEGSLIADSSLPSKKIDEFLPGLCAKFGMELQRLQPLHQQLNLYQTADKTLCFLELAKAIWVKVDKEKAVRGFVSYSDLVIRAGDLLNGEGASWVRYKLDQGIDHILVDEAQDTSAAQWRIITGLAQEFFAGASARDTLRTLFAVGDDKQSVFSFQGANPQLFEMERNRVMRLSRAAGLQFEDVKLNLSFRSSTTLMRSIDQVFSRSIAAAGVTIGEFPPHQAAKQHLPGRVEIWPLERKAKAREMEGFEHPFDRGDNQGQPRLRLARRIAREVQQTLNLAHVYDGEIARKMQASDVLILVRTRGPLFDAILRELKRVGLPVAGADRLVLNDHIVAMDLMALGHAMLLPEDDLNFACLLKSPLIGFNEDDLFALAYQREVPLYAVLRDRASERPHWQVAHDCIEQWRSYAKLCRPYEFYTQVLGPDEGRLHFYSRIGREAEEVLDEFLNAAISFEKAAIPTLQNFMGWLQGTRFEIKREMQQGQNEIRVMTVHNSKGLEAKWIILADSVDRPGSAQLDKFFTVETAGGKIPIWAPRKQQHIGVLETACGAALEAQGAEYRRLLYVALTRAEERLTICGAEGKGETSDDCWYALVQQALQPYVSEELDEQGSVSRWVIHEGQYSSVVAADEKYEPAMQERPVWLNTRIGPAAPRFELSPSHILQENLLSGEAQRRAAKAKKRGALLHQLLEYLPSLRKELREEAAMKFLARAAAEFDKIEITNLFNEALNVLALPFMLELLQNPSQAEVPIAAELVLPNGKQISVNGQIDRLVVTKTAFYIIDFKSGHAPEQEIYPENYIAQLGYYREALKQVAGGREIFCYILWTEIPRLDELQPIAMEQALLKAA